MELDEGDIKSLMQIASARPDGSAAEGGASNRAGSGQESASKNRRRGVRGSGPRSSGTGQRSAPTNGPKLGAPNRSNRQDKPDRQAGANQPDPMKTAFGYIGADSFTRQRQDQGSRRPGASGGGGQKRTGRGR